MFSRVDWLSFTFDVGDLSREPLDRVGGAVWTCFIQAFIDFAHVLTMGLDFVPGSGRAPFNASFRRSDGGVVVFYHPSLKLGLVEISGTGCTDIHDSGVMTDLIHEHVASLTRLDFAVDIDTTTRPNEFAVQRDVKRFQAHGEVVSVTGETYYVGSMKSERYARVYRYNPPHPRAQWLRVEHVFRKESARLAGEYLHANGWRSMTEAVGKIYGWTHSDWSVKDSTVTPFGARTAVRPELGKTEFWLYNTVVPCIARLLRDNQLVWSEFERAIAAAVSAGDGSDTDTQTIAAGGNDNE